MHWHIQCQYCKISQLYIDMYNTQLQKWRSMHFFFNIAIEPKECKSLYVSFSLEICNGNIYQIQKIIFRIISEGRSTLFLVSSLHPLSPYKIKIIKQKCYMATLNVWYNLHDIISYSIISNILPSYTLWENMWAN